MRNPQQVASGGGAPAGPYRAGAAAELLRPPGVPSPPTLAQSRLMDAVCLDLGGSVITPKTLVLHVVMAVVVFGPPIAWGIGLAFGGPIEPIALVVICTGLFGWVWRRAMRGNRIGALINDGRLEDAERLIGSSHFGLEISIGLVAQLRGDHQGAANAFRKALVVLERRPHHIQPIHAQAYAREAIALANLGRLDEAHARLAQLGPGHGEYLAALRLVAWSYLSLVGGQPLAPDVVDALERTFHPIRGSWGGLALAAYGRERQGDMEAARRLLAEERGRVGSETIAGVMPQLAAFARQRAGW